MSKEEAIEAMLAGQKVTHRWFTEDEYIFMKNGKVYSEDGVCHGTKFWDLRKHDQWNRDWKIYTGKP